MLYDLCHIHECPSLLQERMIGEIDKLRNEIDHLKRRSGAFGDGAHPRYLSQLSHNIISFFTQFRVLHVLPLKLQVSLGKLQRPPLLCGGGPRWPLQHNSDQAGSERQTVSTKR